MNVECGASFTGTPGAMSLSVLDAESARPMDELLQLDEALKALEKVRALADKLDAEYEVWEEKDADPYFHGLRDGLARSSMLLLRALDGSDD